MAQPLLDPQELDAALGSLSGWTLAGDGKSIARRFEFANFNAAFGFMTRVALAAEKLDHHPDWSNVYRTVDVALSTHDSGGVTALDIKLAGLMDKYAAG